MPIFLTSFGFKFRSILNFSISLYALSVFVAILGYGESGLTNFSKLLEFVSLDSLSSWLNDSYNSLIDLTGVGENLLHFLTVLLWPFLTSSYFFNRFSEGIPHVIRLGSNSAFGVLLSYCLSVDLARPGHFWNLSLLIMFLVFFFRTFRYWGNRLSKGSIEWLISVLTYTLLDLITASVYAFFALPVWVTKSTKSQIREDVSNT